MNSVSVDMEVEILTASGPATYRCSISWEKPPPLEHIEGHMRTLMKALDEQAFAGTGEDDEEETA